MAARGSKKVKAIALPIFLAPDMPPNFAATVCLAKVREMSNC